MNSHNLSHIALAVKSIFSVAGSYINVASETENEFTINVPISVSRNISTTCQVIEPFLDIVSVKINFSIQQVSASLSFQNNGRLKCTQWNEDADLSITQLNEEASVVYQQLKEDLSKKNIELSADDFHQRLSALSKSKVPISLSIYIHVDKKL